jgi:hypothetical protein
VTFLERLRFQLANKFSEYKAVQTGITENEESSLDKQKRILEQYHGKRGDWAWEIARSFARTGHISAGYIDAYANEGYLETATQWDNVRKLVEMLDYHPAPPASAYTPIALMAKKNRAGTIARGLQVKYPLPEGGDAILFETLEDVDIDNRLNDIHPLDYNRSPQNLNGNRVILHEAVKNLAIGDPILFEKESTGFLKARLITGIRVEEEKTLLFFDKSIPPSLNFTKGDTYIHLQPRETLSVAGPFITGSAFPTLDDRVLRLKEKPEDLTKGRMICIDDGTSTYFRRVEKVKGNQITLNEILGKLSLSTARVGLAVPLAVSSLKNRVTKEGRTIALKMAGDLSRLQNTFVAEVSTTLTPLGKGKNKTVKTLQARKVSAAAYEPVDPENPDGGGYTTLRLLNGDEPWDNPQNIWVKPIAFAWNTDTYLKNDGEKPFATTIRTNKVKKTSAHDFALAKSGSTYGWGKLENVTIDEDASEASLNVDEWFYNGIKRFYLTETLVYSHFKTKTRVDGWDINTTPLNKAELFMDESIASLLWIGQKIIVEDLKATSENTALLTTISNIDKTQVTLTDSLEDYNFSTATTLVYGNVVPAGHGESKTQKVLGSGDGAQSFQSFLFPVEGVSFIADAAQSSGVAADILVTADNVMWEQVSTLKDSKPEDHHYIIRMTEDARIRVAFGDGVNGRRLPTGKNNIRISYRMGNGLIGNIPVLSLEKLAKPHRYVEKVRQPFKAGGGNDLEDSASLRESAPAKVLTLERAVSVTDFANLATSHSSIWQSKAFLRRKVRSRNEHIEVIVVPAGGDDLESTLSGKIKLYLETYALPFVQVSVTGYVPTPVHLNIELMVPADQYVKEDVTLKVRDALLNDFTLRKRKIGQAFYLSEVYKTVEQVEGVSQSVCGITEQTFLGAVPPKKVAGEQGDVRVVLAHENQVVYIDENNSSITIT